MKFGKKLLSLAAATALVAGVGLAAATPASAKAKVSGSTSLTFSDGIAGALNSLGVTVTVSGGAKVAAAKVTFPVTGAKGTEITHRGTMAFERAGEVVLSASNPTIKVDNASAGLGTVFATVGDTVLPVFSLTGLKSTAGKPKVDKKKRMVTVVTKWTGTFGVSMNQAVADAFSVALGLPPGTLAPGQELGTTSTSVKSVSPCKDKQCKKW